MSEASLQSLFFQCCACEAWVNRMVAGYPFKNPDDLFARADIAWDDLNESDYLEAFAGHPRIGDLSSLREKYAATKSLARGEQGGVSGANEAILVALSEGNRGYEAKFGFIFIVSATGKSAAEILDLLNARLPNDRATEVRNAAEEQRKIFQLRLQTLVKEHCQ